MRYVIPVHFCFSFTLLFWPLNNTLIVIQAKSLGSDGQRMTMIDRNNEGPVKPKEVGTQVADVIKRRRNEEPYKMTQKELAAKCNTTPTVIQEC